MSRQFTASAVALLLAFQLGSCARPMKSLETQTIEGVLTVTRVDRTGETITVRNSAGDESVIFVTPQIANLEQLQPGARLSVRVSEEVALGISKAGEPAAAASDAMAFASKDSMAGKTVAKTASVTGVLDAVDTRSRRITLRGPQGNARTLNVADGVSLGALRAGDAVTVTHTLAVATQLIPAP